MKHHLVWGNWVVALILATLVVPGAGAQMNERARELVTQLNVPGADMTRFEVSESGALSYLGAPVGRGFDTGLGGAEPALAARDFVEEHAAAFGLEHASNSIQLKSERRDGGRSFSRFRQSVGGIPVFGGGLSVQVNQGGRVEAVFANTMTNIYAIDSGALSLSATLDRDDAELYARADMEMKLDVDDLFAEPGSTLYLYDPSLFQAPGPVRLVWVVVLAHDTRASIREQVLVDAHSGDTVLHISLVHSARFRLVYDAANVSGSSGTLARSEGGGASGVTEVNNAYDYLGDTYDYFFNNHGRDSLDDNGYILRATVRYCEPGYACPFANAFWDGTAMYFGDGFAAADDVVGHELTHGLTSNTSDLIYFSQSGAINEALSDIFGEFIDITNGAGTDTSDSRWLMGEDVPGFGAIRSMKDPVTFGDPDRQCSPYYHWDSWDNQGVHINSGVINKLAYLLVDGDTFNGETVTPIGRPATSDLFYHAQVNLLNESSDFLDLYNALTQAAINLSFGTNQREAIEAACLAVEIASGAECAAPPSNSECPNAMSLNEGVTILDDTYYTRATIYDSSSCGFYDIGGVWFSFVPPVSGDYLVSVQGSALFSTLEVKDGCDGSVLACHGGNASSIPGLEVAMTSGQTYYIRVGGDSGERGQFGISVSINPELNLETIPGLSFDMNTNPGWTTQGQWAFGQPLGIDGDPVLGATGTNVYGYNLFGAYPNNLSAQYLTTNSMNLTGESGVTLVYKRWLGVEGDYYDNASIQVAGTNSIWHTVWANGEEYFDESSWTTHEVDISAYADNQSSVRVRWVMGATDFSVTAQGWNIDDVEIKRTVVTELTDVWVDFGNMGTELGSQAFPFRMIGSAVDGVVSDGSGTITVKGWKPVRSSDESLTISKPLRLASQGGDITIGEAP